MRCIAWVVVLLSSAQADFYDSIEQFTGNRTKVIWGRPYVDDADMTTANFELVGLDTRERRVTVIRPGPISCANPWITPDGKHVVYTDWPGNTVYLTDWNGIDRHILTKGYGLYVWADPNGGRQWLYYSDTAYGARISRVALDDTTQRSVVWERTRVSIRFRLSADGTRGGGEFPWPAAGVIDLNSNAFTRYGSGCNSQIAPDNSYRFFHLAGSHQAIYMYDGGGATQRSIDLTSAPGIGAYAIWAPKWTSDPRFFTMVGPHATGGNGTHNVYLGRFSDDYASVAEWLQVTFGAEIHNMYAYAWIGSPPSLALTPDSLVYTAKEGDGVLEPRSIRVHATSGGTVSFIVSDQLAGWLDARAADGEHVVVRVDASGMASGVHSDNVRVVDRATNDTASCLVTLRISGASVPTSLSITPRGAFVATDTVLQFTAACTDAAGNQTHPTLTWSVHDSPNTSAPASIDAAGVLRPSRSGKYVVTASCREYPAVRDSVVVTAYRPTVILSPTPGLVVAQGAPLVIAWESDGRAITAASIGFSPDNGETWIPLNDDAAILDSDPRWGGFTWVIPESLTTYSGGTPLRLSTLSDTCLIRIDNYTGPYGGAVMAAPFTIADPGRVRRPDTAQRGAARIRRLAAGSVQILFAGRSPELRQVRVLALNGSVVLSRACTGSVCRIPAQVPGLYVVEICDRGITRYFDFLWR
ncbi:MAG: hypothetical protein GF331_02110 [Chitinivibrionales bacterium]|nr:hypothetical protein [Chitinivibrionales bacterium]